MGNYKFLCHSDNYYGPDNDNNAISNFKIYVYTS